MYQRKRKSTSQKVISAEKSARKKEKKEKKRLAAEALAALHFWQGAPKTQQPVFVENHQYVSKTIKECIQIGGVLLEDRLHTLFSLPENPSCYLACQYLGETDIKKERWAIDVTEHVL